MSLFPPFTDEHIRQTVKYSSNTNYLHDTN